MTVSRQTLHNRRSSMDALREHAARLGLVGIEVTYDTDRGFLLLRDEQRLAVGRYQIVWTWLDGYAAGRAAREIVSDAAS